MQTSCIEGVAIHAGLESCAGVREDAGEALTEGNVGWVIEPRNHQSGVPAPSQWPEGYVFDMWARHWRNRQAHGEVIIVRFADGIVAGFQHRSDAERFHAELVERFARFCLEREVAVRGEVLDGSG